jgi:hypothetical protein
VLPSLSESLSALYGVLRLARFDLTGIRWIDPTPAAARRSFIVLLPLTLVWVLQTFMLRGTIDEAQLLSAWIAYPLTVLNKLVSILFFYLVLDNLLKKTGGRDHFPLYVSTQNWASLAGGPDRAAAECGLDGGRRQREHADVEWRSFCRRSFIVYSWILTVASLRLSLPGGVCHLCAGDPLRSAG